VRGIPQHYVWGEDGLHTKKKKEEEQESVGFGLEYLKLQDYFLRYQITNQ
jgi:hypothetical protein